MVSIYRLNFTWLLSSYLVLLETHTMNLPKFGTGTRLQKRALFVLCELNTFKQNYYLQIKLI